MTVVVAGADADGGQAWTEDVEQWPAGGRRAAVVGDLEEIPTLAVVPDGVEQVEVAVVLDVAAQ